MKKVLGFFKTNFIFTVAIVAAIISCFFVPIDKEYLGYFDIDTTYTEYANEKRFGPHFHQY